MNRFVYLDNNATTKISVDVQEKILPFIDLQFGNPSSVYGHGIKIKKEIEQARNHCANLINCNTKNLIFTSSGSESNCSAFNSATNFFINKKKIITTKVEHSSSLEYCELLKKKGYEIVYLDVDKNCKLNHSQIKKEIDNNTCLVSIQFANNEVGTILLDDITLSLIKQLKNKYNFKFHIDCVQGLGKCEINVKNFDADFISFSGHKIHCPKGIGMLYIKAPSKYTPLITGHQEFGLRGGTENVLGIIAIGEACKQIKNNLPANIKMLKNTKKYLEDQLNKLCDIQINCKDVERIPNTTSITFKTVNGNKILYDLENRGICVSTGSACNSNSSEPSYVLTNMGIKNPENTIRISIDENTTFSQIDYFIENLKELL